MFHMKEGRSKEVKKQERAGWKPALPGGEDPAIEEE
jgi:hypothetical protein